MRLELRDVAVGYGQTRVLEDVSFHLEPGQIGCLLGPSGSGKTTLLRAVAGFESIRGGEIRAEGEVLSGRSVHVPPEQRRIGMVFQDHALLPHLKALANVELGLFRLTRKQAAVRARDMLALVGLLDHAGHLPHQLSGGQQQRIALARALAPEPRMVLFDEPFASLDPELRTRLARDVRAALKRTGTSALLVTHSQDEAFAMADRVGLVGEHRLQQWGAPATLYENPASRFVARFVGQGSLLPATVIGNQRARCLAGEVALRDSNLPVGTPIDILARPENVRLTDAGACKATVTERRFEADRYVCALQLADGGMLETAVARNHAPAEGDVVGFELIGPVVAFA